MMCDLQKFHVGGEGLTGYESDANTQRQAEIRSGTAHGRSGTARMALILRHEGRGFLTRPKNKTLSEGVWQIKNKDGWSDLKTTRLPVKARRDAVTATATRSHKKPYSAKGTSRCRGRKELSALQRRRSLWESRRQGQAPWCCQAYSALSGKHITGTSCPALQLHGLRAYPDEFPEPTRCKYRPCN